MKTHIKKYLGCSESSTEGEIYTLKRLEIRNVKSVTYIPTLPPPEKKNGKIIAKETKSKSKKEGNTEYQSRNQEIENKNNFKNQSKKFGLSKY